MQRITYKGTSFFLPPAGEKTDSRSVGMQYWFKDSMRNCLSYMEQLWAAHDVVIDKLNRPLRVFEPFAGVGSSSSYLSQKKMLDFAIGIDHNEDSVAAYRMSVPESLAYHGDTYHLMPGILKDEKFDYIMFEHNAITMYRAMTEKKEIELQKHLWKSGAQFISFVDVCVSKLHLHYERYSTFFGSPVHDKESYVRAVSLWTSRMFGYSIVWAGYDSVNFLFLFEKNATPGEIKVIDTRNFVDMNQLKVVEDTQLELNFG